MSTQTAVRPAKFADYALKRFLGRGRSSQVYAALPPRRLGPPDGLIALKILREPVAVEQFRAATAELQCVCAVDSPAILTLYEAGRSREGQMYIATQLAPEGSLACPARSLSRQEILRAMARVARGVHALHEAGVIHRAIRPGNVVLTESGGRLAEPDLSPLLWPGRSFHALHPPEHVQYIDPAIIRSEAASRASDVWSLGATLHTALSGRPISYPSGADLMQALRAALTGTPVIDWSLTPAEAELVEACLASDPANRPATALDVAQRIECLLPGGATVDEMEEDVAGARANPVAGGTQGFETVPLRTADPPAPRDVAPRARCRSNPAPVVEGVLCRRGHFNFPGASYCVSCGLSLLQSSRRPVVRPRPVLGLLVLDSGDVCALDADYVIGGEPSRDPAVREGLARPLRLDDRDHHISAVHAQLCLDGWRVLLADRGSVNGTFIRHAGSREWLPVPAGQPVELRSRTTVRLGAREFVFASNRER